MDAFQIKKQYQTQGFFFFPFEEILWYWGIVLKNIHISARMYTLTYACLYVGKHVVQTNLPIPCRLWKGFMVSSLGICDKSDPT